MPAVANEWRGYPTVRLATLALYAGLIVGALWWGMLCGEFSVIWHGLQRLEEELNEIIRRDWVRYFLMC